MTYKVYVAPASGVGGFWPMPARTTKVKRIAELYAAACRAIGQRTKITRTNHAKK